MKKQSITTIINYCTIDYAFIHKCIDMAMNISDEVIVVYGDNFYDGTPEQQYLIEKTILTNAHTGARFISLHVDPDYQAPQHFWPNAMRLFGWKAQKRQSEWVLFLDADELVDDIEFLNWIENTDHYVDAYLLAQYWYFREPMYRATSYEDNTLLIKNSVIHPKFIMEGYTLPNETNIKERHGLWLSVPKKEQMQKSIEKFPMIHHFSWVRTYQQMLKKVKAWSHRGDRDWVSLVNEEFSRPFNGTDFVHGYSFETVENKFDIEL
ncbi:hypothetical protein MHK_001648 [Candidatus Magnetomorum sp. HK-1]|nr:hypothetical protein MHK_001648 [Candidatus Magnetomorum sp. HK-1]